MIHLAFSTNEIERCFPTMFQLRPHLKSEDFAAQVLQQMRTGYQLAYISDKEKDVAIGIAGFYIANSLSWGKYLYVADLVVDQNHRSQGYGEQLFDWVMNHAKDNDCEQFHLDSGVQRFAAHRFYMRQKMNITSHHFVLKF